MSATSIGHCYVVNIGYLIGKKLVIFGGDYIFHK